MSAAPQFAPLALADLRARIAGVVPPPKVAPSAIATGVAALDGALVGGGLPRGAVTELTGPAGSGVTTIARSIVTQAARDGRRVAVIDGARTLYPRDWVIGGRPGAPGALVAPVFIRPPDAARAAWCADVLLRSGAFALVVLDGAPPLARSTAVRLAQLARESDAVLLVTGTPRLGERRSATGAVVRLRCEGAKRVTIEKGSTHPRPVEVSCVIPLARRLCAHPEIPDRRGVAPRQRRGTSGTDRPATGALPQPPRPHSPPPRRGRRMGEPRLVDGRFAPSMG